MRKSVRIILIIVAVLILALGAFGVYVWQTIRRTPVPEIPWQEIDLQNVADGTFTGSWSDGPVAVDVAVTVNQHHLDVIRILKHQNGLGGKAEAITDAIVVRQSLAVDTIAGATHSSRVIRKAVEQALLQGQK